MAQGATAKQKSREELAPSWFLAARAAGYGLLFTKALRVKVGRLLE
jgi:hypothetical protein